MIYRSTITKDKNYYFAIEIPQSILEPALALFRQNCPAAEAFLATKYKRDGAGQFHVTVITPPELQELEKKNQWPNNYRELPFELTFKGIGKVSNAASESYFIVVASPDIIKFRRSYRLAEGYHPHCTLGFSAADIHGVAKDQILWKF